MDYFTINKGILMINLIENALNKFSKKIFSKLIEIPEISHLIQHFLQQKDESIDNIWEYEECLLALDEKSKEVLANINSPSKERSKPNYYISESFFRFPPRV